MRKKILLVEDSPVLRDRYLKVLSRAQVETDLAENGVEALEMASKYSYDLILMDIEMPVMDGLTSARTLRKRGFLNPILVHTSIGYDQAKEALEDGTINGFFLKNDIKKLYHILEAYRC